MAYIYSLADTWNASGTTFTGIGLNVTDTASAAGSLLMDLQVGGVSQFSVTKGGRAVPANGVATGSVTPAVNNGSILFNGFGGATSGVDFCTVVIDTSPVRLKFRSDMTFGWTSTTQPNGATALDVILARDAANTLAQRNGVNAQAFNLYNTYTDASNYERGFMRFVSNTLRIGTEKLGTGTGRNLEFQVDGTTRMSINTGGAVVANTAFYGATGSTYFGWSNNALMTSPSSGVIRLNNFAETDFNRVQFGGTTSSFPAIKRSTTSLQARLADDSAFTNIQGKLTTEANAVSETITATHTLTLYDAAGTAYKVPCVAV